MKVLITGGDSQLGQELRLSAPSSADVTALDVDPLDITNREVVFEHVSRLAPDVVINTAAYTAVDRAEQEADIAMRVNANGAENIALACKEHGARMVQVSTDFVFSGDRSTPYPPGAETRPLSVYGVTKLAGEQRARDAAGELLTTVRTSWLYSRFGQNFALTMLRLFEEREELGIIDDQLGTPTWARGLAGCLWEVAASDAPGTTHHWSDLGVASWYDFCVAVYEESRSLGITEGDVRILPIPARRYPTPAKRPSFSVLDKHETLARLDARPLHWRDAVRQMLIDLQEHRRA